MARYAPHLLSILRIVSALVFITYGTAKIFAWPGPLVPTGPVPLDSRLGMAGLMEIVLGPMLLVGVFTRPIAFVLSGEMAFAYFIRHAPMGFWPLLNDGVQAVLFCFIFLYIAAAGPGPWSVDKIVRGHR